MGRAILTVKTERFSLSHTLMQPPPETPPAAAPPAICTPKRRQILAGARNAFTEMGFERTSVDLIAARAGVSKATLYNHFQDKKALFVACFTEEAEALREEMRLTLCGEPAGALEPALQAVGELLLRAFLSPVYVSLYRHTTAEAGRFPELGQLLFDRGPAVLFERVAYFLRRWAQTGALHLEEPRAAAVQFVMLCQGDLVLRAQLGILGEPDPAALRATVARAVLVFVRAYGVSPGTCASGPVLLDRAHEREPK